MKHLNKTTTILALSLLCLGLSAALYVYMHYSFNGLQIKVADLYEQAAKSKADHDELAKVKENLKTTLGTGDRLSSLFVKEDSAVDFLQVIEGVMKTAGVVGSVENVSEITDEKVKGLNLTLEAKGSWNEIMKFIGLLEKIPYKATIESAAFSYSSGEIGSGWKASVSLKALTDTKVVNDKSETNPLDNQNTDEEL